MREQSHVAGVIWESLIMKVKFVISVDIESLEHFEDLLANINDDIDDLLSVCEVDIINELVDCSYDVGPSERSIELDLS